MPKAKVRSMPPAAPSVEPVAEQVGPPKPIHVIQYGFARGSIFRNETNGALCHTFVVDRYFRNANEQEHIRQTFERNDLRHLAKVATECLNWIEWQERMRTNGGASRV